MGEAREPEPALVVVAVLHRDPTVAAAAAERLAAVLGPLDRAGLELDFVFSDYYAAELGTDLKRGFWVCQRLAPRQALADLKRFTNRLERSLARPDGRRRINLDPGLLSLENFVLASTKVQPQRIYLRDGIFAEVTLWYTDGGFRPLARTYPDYRSEQVRDWLARQRAIYKQRLLQPRVCLDPTALRRAITEVPA